MTVPDQEPLTAENLAASGAHPVEANADDILARMKELEAKYEALARDKGVVTDPKGATRANLLAHANAHAAANPSHDFSELIKTIEDEGANPELVTILIDDLRTRFRHLDLAYLAELGRDFRKAMADK